MLAFSFMLISLTVNEYQDARIEYQDVMTFDKDRKTEAR